MTDIRRPDPEPAVTPTSDAAVEGWGWPGAAGKAHFFVGARSLCGRWMYTGPLERGNNNSKDNCVACRRALAAKYIPGER